MELAKINSEFRRPISYTWWHCVEITPLTAVAAGKYYTLRFYRVTEA
jgi:hypothetical protein